MMINKKLKSQSCKKSIQLVPFGSFHWSQFDGTQMGWLLEKYVGNKGNREQFIVIFSEVTERNIRTREHLNTTGVVIYYEVVGYQRLGPLPELSISDLIYQGHRMNSQRKYKNKINNLWWNYIWYGRQKVENKIEPFFGLYQLYDCKALGR